MKHLTRENRYLETERRKQLIHETCLVIFFQNISKEDLRKIYTLLLLFSCSSSSKRPLQLDCKKRERKHLSFKSSP